MEEYRDITDKYEFVEKGLLEQDGPVAGFLRTQAGEFYVFEVTPVCGSLVFLWVLVSVPEQLVGVGHFAAMEQVESKTQAWISIVEDRRAAVPVLREQQMRGAVRR